MKINHLEIHRFKSIRGCSLECKKVNVFIGEPDTGKTNLLEALELLSSLTWGYPVMQALRLKQELGFEGLFFRQFLDQPARIVCDNRCVEISLKESSVIHFVLSKNDHNVREADLQMNAVFRFEHFEWIRHYVFQSVNSWLYTSASKTPLVVAVPHGGNLQYLIKHNEKVNAAFKRALAKIGLKPRFDDREKTYRMTDVIGEEIRDYALDALSDSVKRLLFYEAILLTVQDSVIVMDEPDVYSFPPYPKTLGEMIAGDQSNQFFLTTHNPYFLLGLVEKTPKTDLAVFVCRRTDDGATEPVPLGEEQIARLIEDGLSLFFNLDDLVSA